MIGPVTDNNYMKMEKSDKNVHCNVEQKAASNFNLEKQTH